MSRRIGEDFDEFVKFLSKRLSKVINIDNYIELPGNVKSF